MQVRGTDGGAGRGPDDGFSEWATARQGPLRRTAYLLCGDWHHAQDLVQETLTRVYLRWSRLDHRDPPDAYARRVLVNAFVDGKRRKSSGEVPTSELPETVGMPGSDPTLRLTVLDALSRIGPSQRAVLVLRYWEDLTQAQTAAVLGCSEGNVKSQAARGLVALRTELARVGIDLTLPAERTDDPDGGGRAATATVTPLRGEPGTTSRPSPTARLRTAFAILRAAFAPATAGAVGA